MIAAAVRKLWIRIRGSRRRLNKSLDDLDREIRNACQPDAAGSSVKPLDIDGLASTEELRLIVGLHLDGWSWHEINARLRNR
jgi:hypothetical protein